jgi:IclR family acetate operon transcriptional repressor
MTESEDIVAERSADGEDKQAKMKKAPAYPISSVDNALRLLLLFRERQQLRLSDVSASLNVAHSTAHRLLAMLMHHDFVRQEGGHGVYTAGPALLEIGYGAVRSMDIRALAGPILTDLSAAIDETVHLAQLEGGRIRYVAGAESQRALRVADRTGQLFPAHRTATGKAILADLTPAQLEEVLASAAGDEGSSLSPEERAQLAADLEGVRERGYSYNRREADNIVSVATSVRNRRGLTVAAINASAPANRMNQRRQLTVVRQLHAAAARLEEILVDV